MTTAVPAPEMKICAVAPWFGGKRSLASRIVAELGPHESYFEPFCGGLSIVLAKPAAKQETVNDLHRDLINLARVLRVPSAADTLYELLASTLFHEGLLLDASESLRYLPLPENDDDARFAAPSVERAYWYMIASWMARNGAAGTDRQDFQSAVRWTRGGGSPTVRFRNVVKSVPAWHERLRNVVMLSRNAFDIIPRFEDAPGVSIYCDPPYAAETRSNLSDDGHATRGGGGGRYLHEFSHATGGLFGVTDDHSRLACMLREFKRTRIVVSSYDCPRYRALYDGWTFVECPRQKNLARANALAIDARDDDDTPEAPEVLIINGPSYTTAGGSS